MHMAIPSASSAIQSHTRTTLHLLPSTYLAFKQRRFEKAPIINPLVHHLFHDPHTCKHLTRPWDPRRGWQPGSASRRSLRSSAQWPSGSKKSLLSHRLRLPKSHWGKKKKEDFMPHEQPLFEGKSIRMGQCLPFCPTPGNQVPVP